MDSRLFLSLSPEWKKDGAQSAAYGAGLALAHQPSPMRERCWQVGGDERRRKRVGGAHPGGLST